MRKFRCSVTKTYEYEIEIDENIWTEENIKGWASVFEYAETLEDIVEILAERKTRYGFGEHIEGFGFPSINGKRPEKIEKMCNPADTNIITFGEPYCDVDIEEIEL